jgi:hypothetical protein
VIRGQRRAAAGRVMKPESEREAIEAALARYIAKFPATGRRLGIKPAQPQTLRAAVESLLMVKLELQPSERAAAAA